MIPGKLGFDFGGVVCNRVGVDGVMVPNFNENYQDCPPVDRAFEVINCLVLNFGNKNCYIVSAAFSVFTEIASRWWLTVKNFHENTGVRPEQVLFCRKRDEKAAICKELGITHFVDDRPQVVETLAGIVPHLYWFKPREQDLAEFPNLRVPVVTLCYSWQHVVDTILADWNHCHEGEFTTEIVGKSPHGIVCRNESLISAAVRAYQFAFKTTLDDEGKLYFPERCRIADYSTELNVLRIEVLEQRGGEK